MPRPCGRNAEGDRWHASSESLEFATALAFIWRHAPGGIDPSRVRRGRSLAGRGPAVAQQFIDPGPGGGVPLGDLGIPPASPLTPPSSGAGDLPRIDRALAVPAGGQVTLAAQLADESPEITRGLTWRVFLPEPDESGKLPLIASAQGGSSTFSLDPGTYLVHAAFGRAGATKRITVTADAKRERLVLDAGGLKLDAILSGGVRIPAGKLRFSIYEAQAGTDGERPLVIPDVTPNTIVRLNAGTYHVVSTYGR